MELTACTDDSNRYQVSEAGEPQYRIPAPKCEGLPTKLAVVTSGNASYAFALFGAKERVYVASWTAPPTRVWLDWAVSVASDAVFVPRTRDQILLVTALETAAVFRDAGTLQLVDRIVLADRVSAVTADDPPRVLICTNTGTIVEKNAYSGCTIILPLADLCMHEQAAVANVVDGNYVVSTRMGLELTVDPAWSRIVAHRQLSSMHGHLVRPNTPLPEQFRQVCSSATPGTALSLLKALVKRAGDPMLLDDDPLQTVALTAGYTNHSGQVADMMQFLLNAGAKVSPGLLGDVIAKAGIRHPLVLKCVALRDVDVDGDSLLDEVPLVVAIECNDSELVDALLARGANIFWSGSYDECGLSAAIKKDSESDWAAYSGYVARLLCKSRLRATSVALDEYITETTPLGLRRLLIAAGATPEASPKWAPTSHRHHELAVRRAASTILLVALRFAYPPEIWMLILGVLDTGARAWGRTWLRRETRF